MKVFHLLAVTFLISESRTKSLTKEVFRRAAEQCCTKNRLECCMDMMTFGKPIRCGYEAHKDLPQTVYKCLQDHIFNDVPEKKTELDDSRCCEVFAHNANDVGRQCESVCKTVMTAPSLSADMKLDRIRQCSLIENPFFRCFTTCRSLRSKGCRIEVVHFNEYCQPANSTQQQEPQIVGC